jgi:hypothetical protein
VKKLKRSVTLVWFASWGIVLGGDYAFAYIDPSAMTYMIQLVAGIVIAGSAAAGFYLRKFKKLFNFKKDDKKIVFNADEDDEGYEDFDKEYDLEGFIESIKTERNAVRNGRSI